MTQTSQPLPPLPLRPMILVGGGSALTLSHHLLLQQLDKRPVEILVSAEGLHYTNQLSVRMYSIVLLQVIHTVQAL